MMARLRLCRLQIEVTKVPRFIARPFLPAGRLESGLQICRVAMFEEGADSVGGE
jgi:hypothetical protein